MGLKSEPSVRCAHCRTGAPKAHHQLRWNLGSLGCFEWLSYVPVAGQRFWTALSRELVVYVSPAGRINAGKKSGKRHSALHTIHIFVGRLA